MINRPMLVSRDAQGKTHLAFTPAMDADFRRFEIGLGLAYNYLDVARDSERTTKTIQESCGATACRGFCVINTGEPNGKPLEVTDALVRCRDDNNCPLQDPPTDDSEPRMPPPAPPALQAALEVVPSYC